MCKKNKTDRLLTGTAGLLLLLTIVVVFPRTDILAQGGEDLLEPNRPVGGEIKAGDTASYQVKLDADEFFSAIVRFRGTDLDVTLYGPGGEKLYEAGNLSGGPPVKTIFLVAGQDGIYRLEIRGRRDGQPTGEYQVEIREIRPAAEKDRHLAAAENSFARGELLQSERKAESLQKAIPAYQEAVSFFRSAENPSRESAALTNLALTYYQLGQTQTALDTFKKVLEIAAATGDRAVEAKILNNMGSLYLRMGDVENAIDSLSRSLEIVRELKIVQGEAAILNNLASIYKNQGEMAKALEYARSSLELHRKTGNKLGVANTLNTIGSIFEDMGQPQEALNHYEEALGVLREIKNSRRQAVVYNNIGAVYSKLGDKEGALENYLRVLELSRAAGHRVGEAHALNNIGSIYRALNDREKALEYYRLSLPLRRATKDRLGEAITLTDLGQIHKETGDWQKALDLYLEALEISQQIQARQQEALILLQMGNLFASQNEAAKALEHLKRSLTIWEGVGDPYFRSGTLFEIARIERQRENFAEAEKSINAALDLAETYRSRVGSEELRTSYFASAGDIYKFYIDLLMELDQKEPAAKAYLTRALAVSERARARTLLDNLSASRIEFRADVDPVLLKSEREIQRELNKKEAARLGLANRKGGEKRIPEVLRQIEDLLARYRDIRTKIRLSSPRHAELTEPAPLSVGEIQNLLSPETVLLEYSLGAERSYVWAVTPGSVAAYRLPKEAEIENAAREVYRLLIARNRTLPGEEPAARRQRLEQARIDFRQAAQKLSEIILRPVAGQLGKKRIVVAAEGALQYVPFAALPAPNKKDYQPLMLAGEIVSVPSAATLAALRKKSPPAKADAGLIAVIADPVFSRNDPRVAASLAGLEKGTRPGEPAAADGPSAGLVSELKRSAENLDIREFRRLRFSRREAEEIASLAPAGKGLTAVDFSAAKDLVTGDNLSRYRIVHFATHGLLNSQNPELSGIVLSLVDERGRPTNGFLRLNEIYNLRLGADLVVLSACQTALGKQIRGEGLVGLTRGFMYAGAETVVASLWQVEDRATAELMKRFYRAMLRDGLTPAAAMRQAQIEMWRAGRWSDPYYWAAFTVQGDWR